MWGVAQISWFVANEELEFVITFPIISTGPGVVAALWAIFMFQEITGRQNYIVLGTAIAVVFVGIICIVLSKEI